MTIFILTTILITGGLTTVQYAYSSGPDILTVKYFGPIATSPAETFIEIYKKIDDFDSPALATIPIALDGEEFMVSSQLYFKDKLNSNTVFRVIERTTGSDDVEIDVVEIHTSCSKPLYMGQIVPGVNAIVTLEVVDGTLGGDSILPDNAEGECTDNKKPKHTATITLKKAITNDNGGLIVTANQIQDNFLPKIDGVDVIFGEPTTISTKEPHTISEATDVDGYSFVLIAGDTDCPSMLDEEFIVKKNMDITCTIYNDDNFVEGETGGDGIIFHRNTIEFMYNPPMDDVIGTSVNQIDGSVFDCTPGLTCIILDPMASDVFIVQDPLINKLTSIVVFNVFPLDQANNELAETDRCVVKTLLPGPEPGTLNFSWQCELIEGTFSDMGMTSEGKYRINYAVIDALG